MKILSPAKINIYLEVLGKRTDGYHDLLTIMAPVSLYDEIYLEKSGKELDFDAPGCGCIATENISYKAAELFLKTTGIKDGVKIRINKNIPFGAGLGGGSSNASHTLVGLNLLFSTGLSEEELCKLAGTIGADCPFFVHGCPSLMGERGDKLINDVHLEDRQFLLVFPPVSISTAKVYKNLKISLTQSKLPFKIEELRNEIVAPESCLLNELEQSAFELHPELKTVKDELLGAGALGALMSGSGSTVFGVFENAEHLENAMIRLGNREGYRYIPTTRTLGGINGDYRS